MLDDLSFIHRVDRSDALGIASKESKQLLYNFNFDFSPKPIDNVVYAAMGGSALAALLSLSWPGYNLPFEVVRNYELPPYVGEKTLCILASYSGNTEETLSALEQAESKNAQIVIIAGGGKLAEIATEKGYPLVLLPQAKQPRYAVFYNLRALVEIANKAGILAEGGALNELETASGYLETQASSWEPTVPIKDNLAKSIALDCLGKSVVIYGGPKMAPAAYKWKISFNENAKHVAWCGTYSEFNHNEFIGWSEQPVDKPYCVIDLRSDLEHPQIQKRFVLSERLLSGRRPAPVVIEAKGNSLIEQLLYVVMLGDFVSIYTAIAGEINPEPVELVEKFKKQLNQ